MTIIASVKGIMVGNGVSGAISGLKQTVLRSKTDAMRSERT